MVVLRINREFMEYMRKKHNNSTRQHSGRTLVELEETDEEKDKYTSGYWVGVAVKNS